MKEAIGHKVQELFDFIFGGNMFEKLVEILSINPSDDSIYYSAWELVVDAYDTIVIPIGLGLMIIWFLVAFIQKASTEQMNFEALFLLCVKLIAAFFLIEHGMEIFAELWGFGNSLVIKITEDLGGANLLEYRDQAWISLTGTNKYPDYPKWTTGLLCYGQLLVPYFICWALSGVASFIAYSRMIEMMLRMLVAPVALSDFISEGMHGTGWRYIKTFMAICLQGFVILFIAKIYNSILGKIITGGTFMEMTLGLIVISFSAAALMFKSLSLCKELVGVN